MSSTDGARILDRGYRRFEGHRSGTVGAVRSVAWHTTRSILGLGRKARHKIVPVAVILIAFLPAVIWVGVTALLPVDVLGDELRPEYWELFETSIFPVLLFAALVAPEALVRDRRDGMLALYLSSPLTRGTYLLSKIVAVLGTMSIIIIGPPLLTLVGYTFEGQGPDGPLEWFDVLGRISLAGVIIVAVYAAVAGAASSITDRRAFASVSVILVLLGAAIVTRILVEEDVVGHNLLVLDPVGLPLELSARVFGDRGDAPDRDVATSLVVAGCAGWITAGGSVIWNRYRRLAAV